jgi:hypothetical protein
MNPAAAPAHPFWDRDPLALVVNLDDRPARWAETLAAAATHLPTNRLVRHSAVRGTTLPGYGVPPWFRGRPRDRTWAGRAGCLLSHRSALSRALAEGREWLLVLEDDAVFDDAFDPVLRALVPHLDARSDWSVCYFGVGDPVGPFEKRADLAPGFSLHRIGGANHTHAYLIHRRALAPVLARWPREDTIWPWLVRHRAVDRWYRRHLDDHGEVLAVSPSMIRQRVGLSDITGRQNGGAGQKGPVTHVGASSALPAFARLTRPLRIGLADAWDVLRAQRKIRRGF